MHVERFDRSSSDLEICSVARDCPYPTQGLPKYPISRNAMALKQLDETEGRQRIKSVLILTADTVRD